MTTATVAERQGSIIRREGPTHLFTVGQTVRLKSRFRRPYRFADIYHITGTLPPTPGGSLQYRIRSDDECYERVTTQETLQPAPLASTESATLLAETFVGDTPNTATPQGCDADDLHSAIDIAGKSCSKT